MPTKNPRLNLTLMPEQYELLSRLSRLQQRSRAAIVMELLGQITPMLERVAVIGEVAQRAQVQAKEGLRESIDRAEAQILPQVEQVLGQTDMFLRDLEQELSRGAAPSSGRSGAVDRTKASGTGLGPRSVTRGPGRGAKARKRAQGKPSKRSGKGAKR